MFAAIPSAKALTAAHGSVASCVALADCAPLMRLGLDSDISLSVSRFGCDGEGGERVVGMFATLLTMG